MDKAVADPTNWAVILFLLSLAIPFGWDAVKEVGWRRYGAGGVAAFCLVLAPFWSVVEHNLPRVGGFATSIATSPVAWFTLLALIAAVFLLSSPRLRHGGNFSPDDIDEILKKIGAGEVAPATRELLEAVRNQLVYLDNAANRDEERISKLERAVFKGGTLLTPGTQSRIEDLEGLAGEISGLKKDLVRLEHLEEVSDLDLLRLLDFSVYSSTLVFLIKLISDAPSKSIPYEEDAEENSRRAICEELEAYVRSVMGSLGDSPRRMIANGVLARAEVDAEDMVRQMTSNGECAHINAVDLLRYKTTEVQCLRLLKFLEHERLKALAKVAERRDVLIDRLDRREKN